MLRTFNLEEEEEEDPWKGILSVVAFAVRSTIHTTMKKTPGQMVFKRDMILNITHQADWEIIKQRKQRMINKNNKLENKKERIMNIRKEKKSYS